MVPLHGRLLGRIFFLATVMSRRQTTVLSRQLENLPDFFIYVIRAWVMHYICYEFLHFSSNELMNCISSARVSSWCAVKRSCSVYKKTGTGVLLTATELPDFLFLDESCSFFVRNVVYYCTPHAYSDILHQKVIPDSDLIQFTWNNLSFSLFLVSANDNLYFNFISQIILLPVIVIWHNNFTSISWSLTVLNRHRTSAAQRHCRI